MNDIEAIEHLNSTDRFRIIERLVSPERYWQGAPAMPRVGLVVDVEATGLDTARDKIIELGLVAFEYDAATGMVYRVLDSYAGFEDPGKPLTQIVRQITGISDQMLTGRKLDDDEINAWIDKADIIIAHNAAFDRQMMERRLPACTKANWACTMFDIDWAAEDILSLKLDYIAFRLGYFFDGHRAVNDAQATLHLLTKGLPVSGKLAMVELLTRAREKSRRFFAVNAPFGMKDVLRERGYRWLPEFACGQGGGKRKGVWSKAVGEADIAAEEAWLTEAVYRDKASMYACMDITAMERYSLREFAAG